MTETSSELKERLQSDVKTAMKSGNKADLATLRLVMAAIKQREVDERISLDDAQIIAVLDKMVKQRKESIEQYQQAQRDDLVAKESSELEVIQRYLPQALSGDEIQALINEAIEASGAESIKDMGKVMGLLKPKLQGRADMGKVSGDIKARLNA